MPANDAPPLEAKAAIRSMMRQVSGEMAGVEPVSASLPRRSPASRRRFLQAPVQGFEHASTTTPSTTPCELHSPETFSLTAGS